MFFEEMLMKVTKSGAAIAAAAATLFTAARPHRTRPTPPAR
jgi:hypothetical protein